MIFEKLVDFFIEKILTHNKILFFTGAGISTSSGIPDFRGPSGIWKTKEPVYFNEFLLSDDKKVEYWQYKKDMWRYFKNAKPSFAHLFIKKLYDDKKLLSVITQNIDGLHQKAGLSENFVIELHGNNSKAVCLNCGKKTDFEEALLHFEVERKPPKCICGGYLKPDVVMFGQALDPYLLNKSFRYAEECDLMISVGSSLVVQPACLVPLRAKEKGAFYVILNKGETAHDSICDLKIDADIDETFKLIDSKIYKN